MVFQIALEEEHSLKSVHPKLLKALGTQIDVVLILVFKVKIESIMVAILWQAQSLSQVEVLLDSLVHQPPNLRMIRNSQMRLKNLMIFESYFLAQLAHFILKHLGAVVLIDFLANFSKVETTI